MKRVLIPLILLLAAGTSSAQTIASLDFARSSDTSLADGGAAFAQARAMLEQEFPDVVFASTNVVDDAFLADVDVFVVAAAKGCCSAITALSASEQQALTDFVVGGGSLLVLADNSTFHLTAPAVNASMLSPIGMAAGGTLSGTHTATIADPEASPVTSGPHGDVSSFLELWPGTLTSAGSGTVLASHGGGATLAVLEPGDAIAGDPISGAAVAFTELSQFVDSSWAQGLGIQYGSHEALFLNTFSFLVSAANRDTDHDGIGNDIDNCPEAANADQTNTDLDGEGDACDADDDNDGLADGGDNCQFTANASQLDLDQDGLGDACDADADGDGAAANDNCPMVPNAEQTNTDGDAHGDDCDADDDGDGVCDIGETAAGCTAGPDNCQTLANASQADLDADFIGDACDSDRDGDGISNAADKCPDTADPSNDDTDFDGLGDACDSDDDNDGVADGSDNCRLIDNDDQTNTDGDGAGDACDDDIDGDDVANGVDNCSDVPNSAQIDFDGDDAGDACDGDIDGDGVGNSGDACGLTSVGADVLDSGCSLEQLCPCSGPQGSTATWRNHGKYVSCTARASEQFLTAGLMTQAEKDATVSAAGQSSCGQ